MMAATMDFELEDVDIAKGKIRQRTQISHDPSLPANVPLHGDDSEDVDRSHLARAGKRQVLKRNFDLVSMIGFSSVLVSLWENMLLSFQVGLIDGGPAGLIYGFMFVWAGILCVYITLGELASMIPTSGGQYHWVSILAPEKVKKSLSYVTGWLTVLGWAGAIAATSFFTSSMIQALIVQTHPEYVSKGWEITLLQWAILLLVLFFNTVLSKTLPAIEVCILIIHILGFFAILIPILFLSPKENAGAVFTTFANDGGWSTQGLAWFVGISGNAAAFVGADGAVHMSEEIKNATKNVPRSIVYSTIFNGILALGMLISFVICAGEITDAESSSPYPYIPIFARLVGQNAGATIMVCLVISLQFCACIAATATSSRLMWAFARDRGLPYWKQLSKVNAKTTIPTKDLLLGVCFAALLGLISIGSTTAFNAIISLSVTLYITYLLACGLLLYRRVRGEIGIDDPENPNTQQYMYTWGPWHVRGFLGIVTNTLACLYLVLVAFFTFWPPFAEVTAVTMNYGSTVFGAVAIFSGLWYAVSAHKVYKGPLVEVGLL